MNPECTTLTIYVSRGNQPCLQSLERHLLPDVSMMDGSLVESSSPILLPMPQKLGCKLYMFTGKLEWDAVTPSRGLYVRF